MDQGASSQPQEVSLPTSQHEQSELRPPLAPCTSRQPLALSGLLSGASGAAKWPWPWATDAPWCRGDGIRKCTELRRGKRLVFQSYNWPGSGSINCIVIVQLPSHVQPFVTPWTVAGQAPLSFSIFWSLLKFMSFESVMLSNHLILCHPLLFLPSIFPNNRVYSNELALCIKWPKYQKSKNTELPYDPEVPLLGIYLQKIKIQKDTCTPEFVSTLFTITKTWKKAGCPSKAEWIKKMWYNCTMEYYSAISKKERMPLETTWMDLKSIILSEVSQRKTNTTWHHLCV